MGEFICIPDIRTCMYNHFGVCEAGMDECEIGDDYQGKR